MKEIKVGKVILTPEGIAVVEKSGIGADLHIGFEEALAGKLARFQTSLMLEKFRAVRERYELEKIILNGDLKYSFGKESVQEWREIKHFIEELNKDVDVVVVKGNHDFYIQNIVKDIEVVEKYEGKGFLCIHGDKEIKKWKGMLIIGNEHPALKLRDELGVVRKYPAYLYDEKNRILVLPSLNPWTAGSDVLSSSFISPVLKKVKKEELHIYATEGNEIYDFKTVKDVKKVMVV